MKVLFILLLLMGWNNNFAQNFHEKSFIDTGIRALHDEGEKCLKVPNKDCKYIYIPGQSISEKKDVAYMDFYTSS